MAVARYSSRCSDISESTPDAIVGAGIAQVPQGRGTFTDLMLYDTASEAVRVHKVRSTPAEPERAMVQGLVELCAAADVEPAEVGAVYHGTTVATNAVLTFEGATAGMIAVY